MARKTECCRLNGLEISLIVLFLLMTAVSVGLIIVLALKLDSEKQEVTPEEPSPSVDPPENPYLIGVGRADCTGPVADLPMMGYANTEQTVRGIHTRLFSRAFIMDDGSKRVVFITADIGMVSQRLRLEVLQELKAKYGDLYRQDNVVMSGTHTHAGVGGYFQYTLFMITSKGYIKPSIQAIVSGIVKSIDLAHRNLRPGRIFINKGQLVDSNLNRSPHSYMNNPEEERNRRQGPFVAGFSSSNLGDSSPNILGPVCVNTGEKCDYLNSSCPIGGKKECLAFGPGEDMFESTRMIGENMYKKAKELYSSAKQELHGPVYGAHQWVNMTDESVPFNSTHTGRTCKPALGHSFAAGTTDGGGEFNFMQGDTNGDPFWDGIRDAVLGPPSNETTACHRPKPILFSTGEMDSPLPWHPAIVDVQIITIGSLAIVAVPGEFTTMSGRRIREAVKKELEVKESFANAEVVVAGLCNIYTHYITTYEEYQIQRYEGASTIFGPHTLLAYIQRYRGLAKAIAHETIRELPKGPEPPFFDEDKLFNQVKDPVADVAPADTVFGDILEQVNPVYKVGEIASVTFVAGNPRHSGDIRDKTFVTVERFHNDTDSWEIVHTDASWETRFHWIKGLAGRSQSKVEWHIPLTAQTGTYRIQHFGHYKQIMDNNTITTAYVGTSDAFKVTKSFYYY
ncbi:neutral ceramidase [Sinocyclocheilus rhinocerous]|uniref:neutral ceramidase n=1 Tax=Sinocyclocheilus rhinocerous TaxID=307959 RepID=UPI0007B7925D|nr:PREDICTED: neutral ceramidase [Sinocyclocheilus rhinocerous]